MTRQTSSQVNKTYRAKRAATLARYEAALREIANPTWAEGQWQDVAVAMQARARQALNPDAKEQGA